MTDLQPDAAPPADPGFQENIATQGKDERKRRLLLALLLLLLSLICCVGILFYRYATRPQPIPEILPEPISKQLYYPPAYRFSITGIDKPMGIGVSPDGQ